ncbi:hypothetical protein [Cystobacter ferrugineus]|uniref:DUF1565 domain-containing protein n=1 Tax=Cystobacter ferrugineus TaxID=83449 RepID=A0A1L9B5Y8_9BACT|nr:hypothetical protein [Cystobacter ferrugineus]OJH37679.1 hypothetical protein BON30_26160 [Cystobacter ferrugineus]
MPRLSWMIACLVFSACHPRADPSPPASPDARVEVWVDGASPAEGDGSRSRPFQALGRVLAREAGAPLRVHLAPGRYPGPLLLPAGWELVGTGEGVVVYGEGAETVVRAPGGARLRGVVLEGGGWGLEAAGAVRVEAVRFTGQEQGALWMGAGELTVEGGRFEAGGPEAVGLRVEGAGARLHESSFGGAFRRAVETRDARVELESVRVGGARTALHQARGEARLARVTVEHGLDVGLFVQHGSLRLEDVTVTGHEYGLQTREATLVARGFTSVRPVRAGVALLGTTGVMEDTRVVGSGDFGAVSLLGSDTLLRGIHVEGAEAYGISATRGRLRLERALITGLTSREGDAGDGLHLRDVEVEARGLVVRDVAGSGVLAAQGARVVLRETSLTSCRTAGLWGETLARVTAEGLEVRGSGGPALVALEDGVLRVEDLTAGENAGGLVAAACGGETRVSLGRVKGQDAVGPGAPCVTGPSR